MKKITAVLLALLVVMNIGAAFAADDDFTLSTYTEYGSLFSVDVDAERNVAFVETRYSAAEQAFTHKYESEYSYSGIRSDLLVMDYYSSDRYPVFRTWIYYYADKPQYFHSVSFELNGKKYMFTDVGDKDWVKQNEHDWSESLLIRYGKNNGEFFTTVLWESIQYAASKDENKTPPKMKMTLYGMEEIEVDVPEGFWNDFALLGLPFMSNDFAWIKYIAKTEGSPCKVTE